MATFVKKLMTTQKNLLIAEIKKLANSLDKLYDSELNFRNHCYLRIAYDCTVENRWDLVLKKPFIKYADNCELENAISLLNCYLTDKSKLLFDNEKSLKYRKIVSVIKHPIADTLF